MLEQQLIDYIKKAREAGQTDDQTRDLLYKNGWSFAEVDEAISSLNPAQPQATQPAPTQPEPQMQPAAQPIAQEQPQPQITVQADVQPQAQPQAELQPEPQQSVPIDNMPSQIANPLQELEAQPQATQPAPTQPEPQMQPAAQPIAQEQPQPQITVQADVQPQAQPQAEPELQIKEPPIQQPEPMQTQSKSTYQPQMQNNMPKMRTGSHSLLKGFLIFIIIILLAGVGYVAAGQYFNLPYTNLDSLFGLFGQDPKTVINKMLTNMNNVKSAHTIMQLEADLTSNGSSSGKLILNTNSEVDRTDTKNVKEDGNFTFNFTSPNSPETSATITLAGVGDTYYLKINDANIPNSIAPSYLDISKLKGKWYKIDQNSIKTISQAQSKTGQTTTIDLSQLTQTQSNTSDLVKNIQQIAASEDLFSNVKQLSDEKIGDVETYHYSVTISKDKLIDLFDKLVAAEIQQVEKSQPANADVSNSALIQNMAEAFVKTIAGAIGDVNFEMWIGKSDYLLYQVKFDKNIDTAKIVQAIAGSTLSTETYPQIELKFNMTNSNFNKAIAVQIPANYQRMEDLLLPLMKIDNINSDLSELKYLAMDISFANKNSYSSLCNKGGLNTGVKNYGSQITTLVNDITKQGGQKPICFASAQNYCVSTQLFDKSWLCINKNGKVGKVKCVNDKTVCK